MIFQSKNDELKRIVDVIGAIIGLFIFSPVLMTISGLILLTMGPPVFFVQQRPGFRGKPFNIYKLRTMTTKCDSCHQLLPDGLRLTHLGQWLRTLSLDELPELLNVLKGDMSIVGPRPLLIQYLDRYSPEQRRRLDVKPGLTGWAQINGRNALDWEEKFRLDNWYVDHWSIALDIKIILSTIRKVLKRDGINHPGEATMMEFGSVTRNH